ncbi:B-box zinc finger protein 22 [Oryza brachyantha]|uniref:B-box zinc finger protein 22 n=1 Tax=Oryza brachyantha TaxID=4533 RepID=UPI001ADBFD05|nr:B-box zinc finger protein 22 [Oryza brachyantha]
MKVLCSGCEAAEARVLCCADDAALCPRCDRDVHAANRLAGKHHRLPLLSSSSSSSAPAAAASSSPPNCDICQESHAYFFCVEDRALLCRSCDVAVHTANAFVSAHRRFLLTGVQVGLDPAAADDDNQPDPEPHNNNASSAPPLQPPPQCARKRSPSPLYSDDDVIDWATGGQAVSITGNLPDWSVVNEQFSTPAPAVGQAAEPVVTKTPPKRSSRGPVTPATAAAVFGNLAGGSPDWPLDEFFGFAEFNAGFGFTENTTTSKADSGKLGSMDGTPNGRSSSSSSSAAAAAGQDFFGQVPDVHWAVPELPSPPTASGLHWQRDPRHGGVATAAAAEAGAVFVPDISSPENPFRCFAAGAGDHTVKRRRRC